MPCETAFARNGLLALFEAADLGRGSSCGFSSGHGDRVGG